MTMKMVLAATAVMFACGSLFSQTEQGAWELSFSGTFGSVSGSSESSSPYGNTTSETEAQGYLSLALRPGFYVVNGLELEPEILWTALERTPPSLSLSGNLAYNFSIPESRVTPFVLAGYGIGNGIPIAQRLIVRSSDDLNISLLNLGAGLKIFVAEGIALRTEYRFQRYSQESTFSFGSFNFTTKTATNFHNVFLGFSVFLP